MEISENFLSRDITTPSIEPKTPAYTGNAVPKVEKTTNLYGKTEGLKTYSNNNNNLSPTETTNPRNFTEISTTNKLTTVPQNETKSYNTTDNNNNNNNSNNNNNNNNNNININNNNNNNTYKDMGLSPIADRNTTPMAGILSPLGATVNNKPTYSMNFL